METVGDSKAKERGDGEGLVDSCPEVPVKPEEGKAKTEPISEPLNLNGAITNGIGSEAETESQEKISPVAVEIPPNSTAL